MIDPAMVVIFPRGQLSAADKKRLTKHGIVTAEADDPKSVVCVLPSVPLLSGNDIMLAALQAIAANDHYGVNSSFVKRMSQLANTNVCDATERAKAGAAK